MRIALAVVDHPTSRGGAEIHYDGLERALTQAGHAVERVSVPCDESTYEGILAGYQAARALNLVRFDLVISTKAPSYNIRHPRHVVHLIHTVRVFYDMFDSWTDGSAWSRAQRDRIRELDFEALSAIPSGRRFVNGEEGANRLRDTLGLAAQVLHPALHDADRFHEGPFEHFLHPGRLHPWKRADLVVEAYRSLSTDLPLLVTGTGEAEDALRRQAAGDGRVHFLGEVSRDALYDLYSRALAVPFVPLREDYGYVALEAMLSGKPIVTTSDSGEPARLVENEVTGLVVEPRADAIAAALERFVLSPAEAKRMGSAGRLRASGSSWSTVVEKLLASAGEGSELEPGARVPAAGRKRVLIVDNQPIEPPIGGGRIRLSGLYSNLPPDLEATYVGTYDWPGPGYRSVRCGERLHEITVPQSDAHFRAHESLRAISPKLTMDVTFPLLSFLSRGFADRVAYEAQSADVIVFSHPWVFPIVSRLPGLEDKPFVYDSQNVEGRLRRSLLGEGALAGEIAEMVESVERELCRRAAAIFACSEEDAREFVESYGTDPGRVHVVPNGSDVHRLRPATDEERRAARTALGLPEASPVAVFMGSDYAPNAEAARTLCRDVAPQLPDVQFVIIGGCTKELGAAEVPANVRVLGVVDAETRDRVLAAADVAVNPMSRGSGTNIKMLDFFCAGLPVVTTPLGARGLAVGGETAYVVAGLTDFAAAVRALLTSPDVAQRMSRAARLLAESRYDWRQIGASAGRILRKVVGESRGAASLSPPMPSNRPRIALLSTWKTRCGIADYSDSLARGFPRDGEWLVYAEARGCGVPESPGVRKNWEIGLANLSRLERDLDADPPDVLLVQHNPAFFGEEALCRLLELAREKEVPVALTLHALRGLRIDAALASEMDQAGRIYVHHPADAQWLARLSVKKGVRVVPHGIGRLPERSAEWVKNQIGLGGRFLIGHFGYLRPHKGVLELIEAFERVAAVDLRAELLLLCSEYPSADSRDYRPRCENRITDSAFSGRIHASFDHLPLDVAGFLLQGCDVLVFPYLPSGESSSAAVRLAFAARRPIIVSDSAIFEELDGVVAASSVDPEPLAATIRAFASAEARSVAQARVRRFASQHEWKRVAGLVWGDLRSLVEERSRTEGAA